jgi:hypothetical protein
MESSKNMMKEQVEEPARLLCDCARIQMGERLDRFFKKAGDAFREFAPVLLEMLYAMQQAVERQQREREERERTRREARSVDINNRRAEMQKLPATLTVVEWLTILDYFDWKCAYCKDSPYEE